MNIQLNHLHLLQRSINYRFKLVSSHPWKTKWGGDGWRRVYARVHLLHQLTPWSFPQRALFSLKLIFRYLFSQFSVTDKQHVCETNTVWETGSVCETACVWETVWDKQCVCETQMVCIWDRQCVCVCVCVCVWGHVWNMYQCMSMDVYTCVHVSACVWGVGGGVGWGGSACMGMKEQARVEARETLTTEQWASKVNLASRIKHWGWQKNLASALPCDTAHQNASHIFTHTLTHMSTHTDVRTPTCTNTQTYYTSRHHTNWATHTCTATLHPHTWTHWHHTHTCTDTHTLTSCTTHYTRTDTHTHQDLPTDTSYTCTDTHIYVRTYPHILTYRINLSTEFPTHKQARLRETDRWWRSNKRKWRLTSCTKT